MKKNIFEGLDYHDLDGQIDPVVTVDEYVAKMGEDSDIVTLTFTIRSELAGQDLVDWFERGYDYILDASCSQGEVSPGKYLVFVEMNRRSTVPDKIIELLTDLNTLTNLKLKDWSIEIDDETYDADKEILKQKISLSPHDYRKDEEQEEKLNEYREIAGLQTKRTYKDDSYLKSIRSMAGL